MNRVADLDLRREPAATWADRNQRWLTQRLEFWRRRLEQLDGEEVAAGTDAPPESADDAEAAPFQLGALFGLSAFEQEIVVLAVGLEIDAALRRAVARAQGGNAGMPVRLSFSLALALIPDPHWDALSPLRPLRHWSLVEFDTSVGMDQAQLRVDERVLHHLTGVAAFDQRLVGVARREQIVDDPTLDDTASDIAKALADADSHLLVVPNALHDSLHRTAGRALVGLVFRALGLGLLWTDAEALTAACGGDAHDTAALARRLDREAALSGAGIAIALDAEPHSAAMGALSRLVGALRSPVVVLGMPGAALWAELAPRRPVRFNVSPPPVQAAADLTPERRRAVQEALEQFRVDTALVHQALAIAAGTRDDVAAAALLWDSLRESARGGLDALAQRIVSRTCLDDLVVPPNVSAQLREIASQLKHRYTVHHEWGFAAHNSRGLGIAALFTGESGTGKTMAAEAIANEVRLDLYRIDLAGLVSKYIGETEKNLSKVFDAAERSGAVLLFDEADALFGKRSEVKDSHDRYANIEIAYLLQRIEAYRGLAILTTNMKSALDRAFLRRIRFVVQFPFPDAAARAEIWRRSFPAQAPFAALDWAALAKLQLAGGNIRGIAVNAAFRAAERGAAIEQADVIASARTELSKLERPIGDNPVVPA